MKSKMDRVPDGFVGLDIYGAYINYETREIVLLGEPEPAHDCDFMGCGSFDHVLVRSNLSFIQLIQLGILPPPMKSDDLA